MFDDAYHEIRIAKSGIMSDINNHEQTSEREGPAKVWRGKRFGALCQEASNLLLVLVSSRYWEVTLSEMEGDAFTWRMCGGLADKQGPGRTRPGLACISAIQQAMLIACLEC